MIIDDIDLVRRLAADLDYAALDELTTRHGDLLEEEIQAAFMRIKADAKPDDGGSAFAAAIDVIADNARDYRASQGSVRDWMGVCARVAMPYWLKGSGRWTKKEDSTQWGDSPFNVTFRAYSDELLTKVAEACPVKAAPIQPPRNGCSGPCMILRCTRDQFTWKETAAIVQIKEGTIYSYAKRCRTRADDLFFGNNA